ncbi:LTA synthase family protein [Pontibacter silvestris]|uniref:LTA synthase family protein n=1 Tax=Pontibacter silvestris TaxID=2305183 RepID=A0ABW4X2F7_9BACT|nr:LTA synthase family protein [Pontibacter silvestris]MCC9135932.1 LTA synthase family protein [Pontibacter silvestris]
MFNNTLKLLLKRLGLLLGLYTLLRIAFYFFNYKTFASADVATTLMAFVHGLRFDVAALCIINSPFILLSLFPHGNTANKTYQQVLLVLFLLLNMPFVALSLVDAEFFKFVGKRSSNEVFTITGDILDQLGQLIQYYLYLVLLFLLLVMAVAKAYPRQRNFNLKQPHILWRYLCLLVVAAFIVLGIRGGLQLKPLRVSHAFVLEPAILGHLTLNSPFTFIKSIGQPRLEEKHYFPSDEATLAAMPFDPKQYMLQDSVPVKENIVIIVLESFAAEYVGALNNGKGYTPYLDSLAAHGLLFRNGFANGRKSIEALPSVLAGLPSLLQEPYITSSYQSNTLYGLGTVLQGAGYHTAFFHGAANGTMGFNNFSNLVGIQDYYGLDEYPSERREQDFDGRWGIFDEPYLQHVAKKLTTFKQPFMATLFTLSSHHPYTIPAQHKGQFPKGELEIHESVGYADYALREFFKTASKQPWYNNTLFILTADHTQMGNNPAYQNEPGYFRIPIMLFHPNKSFENLNPEQVVQQADIFPTVVDYLNIKTNKVLPFGQSMLDTTVTGKALFYSGNSYYMVQQQGVTELSADDQVRFYTFPGFSSVPIQSKSTTSEQQLKAYVQYLRNGLIGNKLYFWLNE